MKQTPRRDITWAIEQGAERFKGLAHRLWSAIARVLPQGQRAWRGLPDGVEVYAKWDERHALIKVAAGGAAYAYVENSPGSQSSFAIRSGGSGLRYRVFGSESKTAKAAPLTPYDATVFENGFAVIWGLAKRLYKKLGPRDVCYMIPGGFKYADAGRTTYINKVIDIKLREDGDYDCLFTVKQFLQNTWVPPVRLMKGLLSDYLNPKTWPDMTNPSQIYTVQEWYALHVQDKPLYGTEQSTVEYTPYYKETWTAWRGIPQSIRFTAANDQTGYTSNPIESAEGTMYLEVLERDAHVKEYQAGGVYSTGTWDYYSDAPLSWTQKRRMYRPTLDGMELYGESSSVVTTMSFTDLTYHYDQFSQPWGSSTFSMSDFSARSYRRTTSGAAQIIDTEQRAIGASGGQDTSSYYYIPQVVYNSGTLDYRTSRNDAVIHASGKFYSTPNFYNTYALPVEVTDASYTFQPVPEIENPARITRNPLAAYSITTAEDIQRSGQGSQAYVGADFVNYWTGTMAYYMGLNGVPFNPDRTNRERYSFAPEGLDDANLFTMAKLTVWGAPADYGYGRVWRVVQLKGSTVVYSTLWVDPAIITLFGGTINNNVVKYLDGLITLSTLIAWVDTRIPGLSSPWQQRLQTLRDGLAAAQTYDQAIAALYDFTLAGVIVLGENNTLSVDTLYRVYQTHTTINGFTAAAAIKSSPWKST